MGEVIPFTLAENAGLPPIEIVTALRAAHANGEKHAGINVRKGVISNIVDENVLQPLLTNHSIVQMATETVRMILKIDDLVMTVADSGLRGTPIEKTAPNSPLLAMRLARFRGVVEPLPDFF